MGVVWSAANLLTVLGHDRHASALTLSVLGVVLCLGIAGFARGDDRAQQRHDQEAAQ